MKKILISSYLVLLLSGLSGCVDQYGNSNYEGGSTLGGALGGAFIGSKFGGSSTGGKIAGGMIGAFAGGLIGNKVGKRLDARAQERMNKTALYTLNNGSIGQDYGWESENTRGSFMVTRDYNRNNRYCREFTQKIYIDGKQQNGYGTACRQPDGFWQIMN